MKLRQNQKPTVKTKSDIILKYAAISIATAAIIFAVVFIYNNFINADDSRAGSGSNSLSGGGYALALDGNGDYIALPEKIEQKGALNDFTIEVWVNTTTKGGGKNDLPIIDYDGDEYLSLYIVQSNGKVGFKTTDDKENTDDLVTSQKINDGEWHHLAAVYDGTDKTIYIDGKVAATSANAHNGRPIGTGEKRYGFLGVASKADSYDGTKGSDYFAGYIDELRIWTAARSVDEIRQKLTEKLTGSEPELYSYFSFDEGQGSTITDMIHGEQGALNGDIADAGWITSGIYIGEQSFYTYDYDHLTYGIEGKGEVTVTITNGTPEGIHIYYVSKSPNTTTLPDGITSFEDYYFGVYVMGDTEYSFTFDYNTYGGEIAPEALAVAKRPNGSNSWINGNAQKTAGASKLVIPNQNGTEYIIGSSETVMPIELMSFDAQVKGSDVEVAWTTSSEINNDFFTVERSTNGKDYEVIGTVNGAGNSQEALSYTYTDNKPVSGKSYYRLKQTDFDGKFEYFAPKFIEYGAAESQDVQVSVFPNPSLNQMITVTAEGLAQDEEAMISMMDLQGNPVFRQSIAANGSGAMEVKIDPTSMSAGNYVVVVTTGKDKFSKQLILRK